MHPPARWNGDPDCGHLVAHPYQTHYCSYIRVPRLLSLQQPVTDHPDELLAILALQAIELWLKVIVRDVQAGLAGGLESAQGTFETSKLLQRAARLIRLLDHHGDVAESILADDLGLHLPLAPEALASPPSIQTEKLRRLTAELDDQADRLAAPDSAPGRAAREVVNRFGSWSARHARLLGRLLVPGPEGAPDFGAYLALEALLDLQQGVKGDWAPAGQPPASLQPPETIEPDELMFIVVHQAFELWFRALLHELDIILANLLSEPPDLARASHRLHRVLRVQELLIEMIHVPATMLPLDFLQFRSQTRAVGEMTYERGLSPASGTESYQFRELEILGGLKGSPAYQQLLQGNPEMHIRFLTPRHAERLQQPDLPEAFARLLRQRGLDELEIFTPADQPNPHADLAELADLLLTFDEFFLLWRVHHLAMVQSMIGRKSGTGFLGPEYLRETIGMGLQAGEDRLLPSAQVRPRFFENLWEARTRMRIYEPAAAVRPPKGKRDG